jgi:hypothetical protein
LHLQLDSRPGNADVSADGLALRFAPTPGLDVVGTMSGVLGGTELGVVVEVLAASHRVHLFGDDGILATEQVACVGDGRPAALPAATVHDAGGHRLEFTSTRPDLDATGLARLAGRLRTAAADPAALVVSFPGHRDALTSVRLTFDGWETWHLYPGERPHAVRTRTSVTGP